MATKKLARKKVGPDHVTFYNSGRVFGKDSAAFKFVKERVHGGEHVHVQQPHPWTVLCWNGDCHKKKDSKIKKGMSL